MRTQLRRPASRAGATAGFVAMALAMSLALARAAAPSAPDRVCGLKNAEDLIHLPGSRFAITSRLAKDPAAPGGFSLVDLEQRTARVLMPDVSGHAAQVYADCPGAPVAAALVTHGLDVRQRSDGTSELFAVNHGGRESIEVFDIRTSKDGPNLKWKGCIILPSDVSANAVTSLPDGVAVTSFGDSGDQGLTDLLDGRPAGFVDRWS